METETRVIIHLSAAKTTQTKTTKGTKMIEAVTNQDYQLLSVKEVSKRLSVHNSVVYDLVNAGEIESLKVKTKVLVAESELRRFIDSRRNTGA